MRIGRIISAVSAFVLMAGPSWGAVNITLKGKVGSTTYWGVIPAPVLYPGVTVEVQVWAQDPNGVLGIAGDIVPVGGSFLSTPTTGATWAAPSSTVPLYGIGDGSGAPGSQIGSYKVYDINNSFAGNDPAANVTQGDYVTTADACTGYTVPAGGIIANRGPVTQAVDASGNYTITGWNVGGIPTANGGMSGLGSGQALRIPLNRSYGAGSAGVMVASYTITYGDWGWGILTWVDSGKVNASSHGGWYTAGVPTGDDGVGLISNLAFGPEPATMSLLALGGVILARRRNA